MIRQFKYIQNIGRFATVRGSPDLGLKRLSLIYSENGRGKTTLCAILRSLSSGDSSPILERRRLSAASEAKVVVDVDGKEVVFDGSSWSSAGPTVLVFDEHFVDANVHSGLSIEAGHRQNLHVLVIGEEGVRYQRRVEELGREVARLQAAVREKEGSIPAATLGGMSLDEFCALPKVDGIEQKLDVLRKSVAVLRDAQRVRSTPEFEAFALPLLEEENIRGFLRATLAEVEQAAVEAVNGHCRRLGERGEVWVADGVRLLDGGESCPFCGQGVSVSTLIAHYQAYFSAAYREHNRAISTARARLEGSFGGDALARVQRGLQRAKERHSFWAKYMELPDFTVNVEEVAAAWTGARNGLLEALGRKAARPLEAIEVGVDVGRALSRYAAVAADIHRLSSSLLDLNELVATAKEKAEHGSLETAESELKRLEATERRHDAGMVALCRAYVEAKEEKAAKEREKEEAREALRVHRDRVFGTYQAAINTFLVKFNSDFRVDRLAPLDARGVPSSSYEFLVNRGYVGTARAENPEPSFATVLSSGDRNTLGLAFFFATLQERGRLDDAILAIDDPASSLDDGRELATVQEIRGLVGRANQVVVLAHARGILCRLWERADKDTTATIEIRNEDGEAEASTLAIWNAEAASVTEYDRLYASVREYAEGSRGEAQQVAVALRPLLEGFLRVACVESFPPGRSLGGFLMVAKQAAEGGSPILSEAKVVELDNLREYVNQFHHNTNTHYQESLSNVNEKQLNGYARRVVNFTRGG